MHAFARQCVPSGALKTFITLVCCSSTQLIHSMRRPSARRPPLPPCSKKKNVASGFGSYRCLEHGLWSYRWPLPSCLLVVFNIFSPRPHCRCGVGSGVVCHGRLGPLSTSPSLCCLLFVCLVFSSTAAPQIIIIFIIIIFIIIISSSSSALRAVYHCLHLSLLFFLFFSFFFPFLLFNCLSPLHVSCLRGGVLCSLSVPRCWCLLARIIFFICFF